MMNGRFPRTLDEAFGPDATSACAITCYRQRHTARWILWACIAAGFLALAVLRGLI